MADVRFTSQDLRDAGGCESGIVRFEYYSGGVYEVNDYDLDNQVALIRGPLGCYWAWAVKIGVIPEFSMSGVDLSGARISADLQMADLSGADLSGADLRGSILRRATLVGANLTGANLHNVSLFGADLTRADFTEANLTNAQLGRAVLHKTKMAGADTRGAKLPSQIVAVS